MFYTIVAFSIHLYIVINDSYTIEEFFPLWIAIISHSTAKTSFEQPK